MDPNSLRPIYIPNTRWQVVVPYDVTLNLDQYHFVEPLMRYRPNTGTDSKQTRLAAARQVGGRISYGALVLKSGKNPAEQLPTCPRWAELSPVAPPPIYQSAAGQALVAKMVGKPYSIVRLMGGFYDVLSSHKQLVQHYPCLALESNRNIVGQVYGRGILNNPTESELVDCVVCLRRGQSLVPSANWYDKSPPPEIIQEQGDCLSAATALNLVEKAKGVYFKTNNHIQGIAVRSTSGDAGTSEIVVWNDFYLLGQATV